VLVYGEPRLTGDIDITLGVDSDKLSEVMQALKSAGLKPIPKNVTTFVRDTMVLPSIHKSGIRVDLIFSFSQYERQAVRRAKKIKIGGSLVLFASPEDLIIHKIFAGRPIDLQDVRGVLLKNPRIDIDYIKKSLKSFEAEMAANKNFVNVFEGLRREVIN